MIYGAGTSRSGARTLAAYLNDAGFEVGYESTAKQASRYGRDPEAVRQLYLDLATGDISYLTAMALDIIADVDPGAKFIHYMRHPYDVVSSLVSSGAGLLKTMADPRPQFRVMTWTPRTGVWRGWGNGSVGVVNLMIRVRNACWPDVKIDPESSLVQQMAWMWTLTHERIIAFLAGLDGSRHIQVRAENLRDDCPRLLNWLGSNARPQIQHLNKRPYTKAPLPRKAKEQIFELCGSTMAKLGYGP